MVVLFFLAAVAAAAYAGIAGADPVWVLGTVSTVTVAGWALMWLGEVARGRERKARPSAYPGQALVARVALWWLAYRLAHPAIPAPHSAPQPRSRRDPGGPR